MSRTRFLSQPVVEKVFSEMRMVELPRATDTEELDEELTMEGSDGPEERGVEFEPVAGVASPGEGVGEGVFAMEVTRDEREFKRRARETENQEW
jgi:hypothetical protein